MIKIVVLPLFFIVCIFSRFSDAGTWCDGSLRGVYVNALGSVVVKGSWREDWTTICNLKGAFGGIDATTCAVWSGLAAKATEKSAPVTIMYSESLSCNVLQTYDAAPAPFYFMLKAM